ncbi:MAG: hypothetical protein ACRD2L_15255 [Terriglobia bacterium]
MAEEAKEQTLEDVYSKFNVEAATQEFTAKPALQQEVKREPPVVPDPALDVDGFRKWAGNIAAQDEQVRQSLYSINERLERNEQERIRGQEEADLKAAVTKVKERVDLDDDFLEVALAHRAKRDDKFMNLWVNRSKKPEAWNAALDVVANDIGKKFTARQDPQLAENQRAMKVSRDQMATTQKVDQNEKWSKMDAGEFNQEWSKLVSGGNY